MTDSQFNRVMDTLVLLVPTVVGIITALLAYRLKSLAIIHGRRIDDIDQKVVAAKDEIAAVQGDVSHTKESVAQIEKHTGEIEVHTNSMKDALVKITGERERAAGNLEGVAQEKARQALRDEPPRRRDKEE